MTKKDYELIAEGLRELRESSKTQVYKATREQELADNKATAVHLADKFEQDNPKFDRKKFLTACGIND